MAAQRTPVALGTAANLLGGEHREVAAHRHEHAAQHSDLPFRNSTIITPPSAYYSRMQLRPNSTSTNSAQKLVYSLRYLPFWLGYIFVKCL